MNGLILRLAGPWMSFGEHAAFAYRDTLPFPTRSALIGLLAAAEGRSRDEALTLDPETGHHPYSQLVLTIRIDRPGQRHTDFHTVGGGRPHKEGLRTSKGTYRAQIKSTLVTRRVYLTDATFTVAIQGPDARRLEQLAGRLEQPAYALYLGRRACIPDEPLLLGTVHADPIGELRNRIPLTLAAPPRPGHDTVPIGLVWEQPPTHHPAAQSHLEVADVPIDFTSTRRTHHTRRLWRTTEPLPAHLYTPHPLQALTHYLNQATP
ncbi:type I-E CRISPR-associated protein Cas5/CasD [Streptomyces sp. fd1-xmd]|uniref:type I-E CRISPR-associated protein Cas5/CasD n=1 Tax=Streptomyces sp. fd1-xmd TaxID=1812480 RepID=UPI00099041BA|nr:type I-E CRISPR-associated protein Cas5/CasD [Streptomyces sp. fd1-xmd]AQT70403.1 type I-E CRISPR-associated protein Cas5/CasD [Streptomyces sp. fd1-xmd]